VETRLLDIRNRLADRELKRTVSNKEASLVTVFELALEMIARGFEFENIGLDTSDAKKFTINEQGKLVPPFISIDGLGLSAAQTVVEARVIKNFISKEDLRKRTKLNKTTIEILEGLGVVSHLDESDQISLF
jgi:DNA polymerase-3 subunit alpha (Gram-positive type)